MKISVFRLTILCLVSFFLDVTLHAQEATNLTADFKKSSIEQIGALLDERYVFPDVAKATGEHLKKQLAAGAFDKCDDIPAFAEALTKEAQSVANDRHLRIRPESPNQPRPDDTPERQVEGLLRDKARQRENMAGFAAVEKLEGNVGYLDLRGFAPPQMGKPVADLYMGLLATSDAVIIDLRKNGGGSPAMVQYLCSYFFDKRLHLNSLYWREGDRTEEFWTLDEVGGKKMPDVPLFVLTSKYTFSGAEEFSYNMQTQKRATLVGETTGGGANPGGGMPVNDQLMMFVPTGRAINPITKTNWEGVGVVPEVKVPEAEALDKALELAKDAAADFRRKTKERHSVMLLQLLGALEKYSDGNEEAVLTNLKQNCEAGLMDEQQINIMGYEYLMRHNKPKTAEHIFWCNTQLFPNSANVYDSYGEALAVNGKTAEAIKAYRKAVETGKATKDPNLSLFEESLKKMEGKGKKGP
ncbi:MAG: hypothetical protein DYG98_16920 [Haliscomenobacteraceae bacterium CHB4]|nr:hypothetical protein [Saprospiraceae bacterium]MCE7924733.1 hypothetical protein [Haliscomenobacteraceae bacterium CHB4]